MLNSSILLNLLIIQLAVLEVQILVIFVRWWYATLSCITAVFFLHVSTLQGHHQVHCTRCYLSLLFFVLKCCYILVKIGSKLLLNVVKINKNYFTYLFTVLFVYYAALSWIVVCIVSFAHKKSAQENAALRCNTPQARSPILLRKPASEHAHTRLLPRLSWGRVVLLSSDTHTKIITSIIAVLLQFVTYLLTLPRI
jgi:hypothetical protein